MNFLLTKQYKVGINTGFLIRSLLENYKDTNEAIAFIKSVPLCSTQNIVLADKGGDLAVVEASPNRIHIIYSTDYVVSANHFVSEGMSDQHANPQENWYHTQQRYATCQNALAQSGKDISFDLAGGKLGFVCQYEKKLNFDTLWSAVYNTKTLEIFRAEGNPSRTRFKEDTRLACGMKKRD